MAQHAPAEIVEFYNTIQALDMTSIENLPSFVLARTPRQSPLHLWLRQPPLGEKLLPQDYWTSQEYFFDYVGRCAYGAFCHETQKHVHSIQGPGVHALDGFPGLYIFPNLINNHLVQQKLVDDILQEVATMQQSHPADEACTPCKEFDEKSSFVSNIKPMLEDIVPINVKTATAKMSSKKEPLGLRQFDSHAQPVLNISLGCDGIMVVAIQKHAAFEQELPATELDDESWKDFLVDSSDDERRSPTAYRTAAILLKSGDVLLFSGTGLNAWYGVPRLIESTDPKWENDCPSSVSDAADVLQLHNWRGCMKGRRLDLFVG